MHEQLLISLCLVMKIGGGSIAATTTQLTITEDEVRSIYVLLANTTEWLHVATVHSTVDKGEILSACEVLYPAMIGFWYEPATEDTNAEG